MTGIFANVRTVENLMALFIPYRVLAKTLDVSKNVTLEKKYH